MSATHEELLEKADAIIDGLRSNVMENWYFAGDFGIEASFDRLVIVEDEFRSGYECVTCSETGRITCKECEGNGKHRVIAEAKCSECQGTGEIKCSACNGTGALIAIPESAKRRPTTGQIVSLGSEVSHYKMGDFVMFPNFCGETFDMHGLTSAGAEQTIVLRIIKEREILTRITGHLKLARYKRTSQVTG